jgi:hypothetical protein
MCCRVSQIDPNQHVGPGQQHDRDVHELSPSLGPIWPPHPDDLRIATQRVLPMLDDQRAGAPLNRLSVMARLILPKTIHPSSLNVESRTKMTKDRRVSSR